MGLGGWQQSRLREQNLFEAQQTAEQKAEELQHQLNDAQVIVVETRAENENLKHEAVREKEARIAVEKEMIELRREHAEKVARLEQMHVEEARECAKLRQKCVNLEETIRKERAEERQVAFADEMGSSVQGPCFEPLASDSSPVPVSAVLHPGLT